jgi:hypothetical protein
MVAALPLALGAAGTAISAVGSISSGLSQAAEARYQSQVAKNNAVIAGQNAAYATQAGQAAATDVGLQERAKEGQLTSGFAANNIDVNTGSAREARVSEAELGTENVQRTLANAGLTAYGYRSQQTGFTAESQLLKAEAPMDVTGGVLGGLGTLATGASNVGFKWASLPAAAPIT